ncbi:unnamed protein product, partial [Mesorhabditis spiculigera]
MSTGRSTSEKPAASPGQPTASSSAHPPTVQLNPVDAVRKKVLDDMQEVMQKFAQQLKLAANDGSRERPEFQNALDKFHTVIDEIEASLECLLEVHKNTHRMWQMFHDDEKRNQCNITAEGIANLAKQGDMMKGLVDKAVGAVMKMRRQKPLRQQEEQQPKDE